jgi:hypothetical protein
VSVDICKMCLESKPLCDSHLMPRGLYNYCRSDDSEPVMFNGTVMMQTSRQIHDYLLCKQCEDILNRGGEDWLLPLLATVDGKFPLHEMLRQRQPLFDEPDFVVYSCNDIPDIPPADLAHFGLGIFWKAAVHSWSGSETEPMINLGPYTDPIRLFLRGGPYPTNIAMAVVVFPPPVKHISFGNPHTLAGAMPRQHFFYMLGVQMVIFLRKTLEDDIRMMDVYSQAQHPIVVKDFSEEIGNRIRESATRSHKSARLLQYIKDREATTGKKFVL